MVTDLDRNQRQNEMTIPLTKGKKTLVDGMDYAWLSQWKWLYHHTGYAARGERIKASTGKAKTKFILMHRLINNTPKGLHTDHINGNPLDNRRANLRSCSNMHNQRNRKSKRNTSSIYKGVFFIKAKGHWLAEIKVNKKAVYLGRFNCEEKAGQAYNAAAIKYFGEYALLNQVNID